MLQVSEWSGLGWNVRGVVRGVSVPVLAPGRCRPLTLSGCAAQLGDLYENDCIFDKFDCCFSGDGSHLATGTYSNSFRVVGRGDSRGGASPSDIVLEASRDPQRKRFLPTPAKVGRHASARGPQPRLLHTATSPGHRCC